MRALTHLVKQPGTSYNPNWAPNNFFLFPNIKNKLRGQRFLSVEEAVEAFKIHVLEVTEADWKDAMIIGSNACKSVLILKRNIFKSNKVSFNKNRTFKRTFRNVSRNTTKK